MITLEKLPSADDFTKADRDDKAGKWVKELLKFPEVDRSCALKLGLGNMLRLARLVARFQEIKLDQIAVFECGAGRGKFPDSSKGSCGDVAYFFAQRERPLDLRYRAFDIGVTIDQIRAPEKKMSERIRKLSISDFPSLTKDVDQQIGKGRLPIIFSHEVMNGTDLNWRADFWHIAGLHFHSGSFRGLLTQVGFQGKMPEGAAPTPAHISAAVGLAQTKFSLKETPIIEVSQYGLYRMWWCNTETTSVPVSAVPVNTKLTLMRPREDPSTTGPSKIPEEYKWF